MGFSSKYQAQIDDLYNQLANRNFSYDYTTDPLYQQYATQYTKNGQRAMEDTYGMVASRTGGLGSSYANVAAQNAYGNYMSELAGKIPELEQIARSNFNSETDRLNGNLSSLLSLRDREYENYVQEMNWYYQQLAAQAAAAAKATSSGGGGATGNVGTGSTGSTGSKVTQAVKTNASNVASAIASAAKNTVSSNKSTSTASKSGTGLFTGVIANPVTQTLNAGNNKKTAATAVKNAANTIKSAVSKKK